MLSEIIFGIVEFARFYRSPKFGRTSLSETPRMDGQQINEYARPLLPLRTQSSVAYFTAQS